MEGKVECTEVLDAKLVKSLLKVGLSEQLASMPEAAEASRELLPGWEEPFNSASAEAPSGEAFSLSATSALSCRLKGQVRLRTMCRQPMSVVQAHVKS